LANPAWACAILGAPPGVEPVGDLGHRYRARTSTDDETDFEERQRLGGDTVHVFRADCALRSRRRILHFERRSGDSWLWLSDNGGMSGRPLRHRGAGQGDDADRRRSVFVIMLPRLPNL